jgi:hypothetical protein
MFKRLFCNHDYLVGKLYVGKTSGMSYCIPTCSNCGKTMKVVKIINHDGTEFLLEEGGVLNELPQM